MADSNTNRRNFVKAAGVAGIAGLAGCSGGSNSDDGNLIWTTTSEGSGGYQGATGMAAVVNENSDDVYMEARTSDGTDANIGRLQREEAQVAYNQNYTVQRVHQGIEPFDQLSFNINQLLHFLDTDWIFVTANEDLTSLADIQSDTRVSPTQEGAGTAPYLELGLDYAVDDYDRVSVAYTQQSGPMQEGRLDVGALPIINGNIEASYVEEQKSSVDLRVLEWPDDAVSELEDESLLEVSQLDMTGFEGYAHTPDEVTTLRLSYNWVVRNDIDYDTLTEALTILYENREGLAEYHDLLAFMQEPEYWVESSYQDVPFHPAAADLYEEWGIWSDDFVRGEE